MVTGDENLYQIYIRLREYLLKDHAFIGAGLNRTNLAISVKTNEKYLEKAVRLYSPEKSLGSFIDALRMEYACFLLNKYPGYTIEAIAAECGIASRSSFYRIFRKHYGCTPCEYRERFSSFPESETQDSRKWDNQGDN